MEVTINEVLELDLSKDLASITVPKSIIDASEQELQIALVVHFIGIKPLN